MIKQFYCSVWSGKKKDSQLYYFSVPTHKYTQVSVLTDQVEAQGAKISDLESSLVEHQHKLNSTEEMLQQVHSFTDLADFESKHLTLDFLSTKCMMYYWTKVRKLWLSPGDIQGFYINIVFPVNEMWQGPRLSIYLLMRLLLQIQSFLINCSM